MAGGISGARQGGPWADGWWPCAAFGAVGWLWMAPVHEVASRNDLEELRRLLDGEPGLSEADEDGSWHRDRPLHVACEEGSMEAARLLLDRGAAINEAATTVYPLDVGWDSGTGCAEVASMLLQRGRTLRCMMEIPGRRLRMPRMGPQMTAPTMWR